MIIAVLLPNTKSHSKCQRSVSKRKKTLIAQYKHKYKYKYKYTNTNKKMTRCTTR